MREFELIIFDCDGVLVDSERITNIVFAQMLNELGLPVTLDDMFERFVGHSMHRCLEIITKLLGRPPPENFVDDYHARIHAALESDLLPVPGVDDVLQGIRVPYCVASNGDRRKMHVTLGLTGLLSRFEGRIFSANDVARGKPAPDLFLHAASSCGASPSGCLVIEDQPTGVAAGIAAGRRCTVTRPLRRLPASSRPERIECSTIWRNYHRSLAPRTLLECTHSVGDMTQE